MRRFFLVLCVCVFLISNSIHAIALRPFSIAWRANPDSPANMSGLLDPPAGKHGYMRIDNGHFMQENGKRFRIWGINISSKACFPRKADAPIVAEHLARFGINCVRFHHMDNPSTNLLDGNPNDTRKLHPEVPDRLDFFIAELKKRGIYINLNLNVSRRFKAGDGVREYEYLGYGKGVTFFDERLIELQKEYARQLLTHRNPYTQTQYSKDPAVIIVEIVNENSLVESWISGRLLGQNTRKYPGTWTDIPPSYGKALTKQYNKWLKQRLSSAQLKQFRDEAGVRENAAVARLRPEQFANASRMRFHTEAAFYMQIEKDFFQDMYRFLKEELGVKAFIVGSSDHNHYRSGYPHLSATSLMDVVDGHVYWQHPSYHSGRRDGRRNFTIPNTPMVNDPLFSTVVQLSRTPVAGKPYTVSETNHPYPNEYACEGIPILAAYAALHDWDGIFFYTFEHAMPEDWRDTVRGHFDFRPDPMKMANLAAWAVTFLRGDVRSAENTIERSYSRDTVVETLRMPASQRPYYSPDFSPAIPLVHSTRITSLNGKTKASAEIQNNQKLVSDTHELVWSIHDKDKAVVTIDTPKSQAIVGFVAENDVKLTNLSADIENAFCSIHCVSLDAEPICRAEKLLITATSKSINQGTLWNDKRTTLLKWGSSPTMIEPVVGKIILKNLKGAASVEVTPLDASGKPVGEAQAATRTAGTWELHIGKVPALWHYVSVQR